MMRPGMTGVREVRSRADPRRFIEYLFAKYGKDLRRVLPPLVGERASFDPKKNLFHKHARINHVIEAGGAKRHKTYRLYQKEI